MSLRNRLTLCGHRFSLTLGLHNSWTILRTVDVMLGVILLLLGLLHNTFIAGSLEGRLRLNKMPWSLIVKGTGREGAGSEGRQI